MPPKNYSQKIHNNNTWVSIVSVVISVVVHAVGSNSVGDVIIVVAVVVENVVIIVDVVVFD